MCSGHASTSRDASAVTQRNQLRLTVRSPRCMSDCLLCTPGNLQALQVMRLPVREVGQVANAGRVWESTQECMSSSSSLINEHPSENETHLSGVQLLQTHSAGQGVGGGS